MRVVSRDSWEWSESSPITWDLSAFGAGRCTGNYGRLRDGRVAVELLVPYDLETDLSEKWQLDSLSGESAAGSVVVRRLGRCLGEPSTRSHRVLRFQTELALECPWEDEGSPPEAASFEFDAVEFGIQGMAQWLSVDHGWFDKSPDDEFYIQPRWQDVAWPGLELEGATLSFRGLPQWDGVFPHRMEMWGISRMRIDLPQALHLSQIEDSWIRPIQRCVELAHQRRCPLTAVWVSRSEWPSVTPTVHDRLWAQVVSPHVSGQDDWHERPLFRDVPLTPREFAAQFTAAAQWSYSTGQVARSFHGDSQAAVVFAQAVTGLEGLLNAVGIATDRSASWAGYLDEIGAALNAASEVPDKVREELLKQLERQPPRSFEGRLHALDKKVCGRPMKSRWEKRRWAAGVVALRNKALHGDLTFDQASDAPRAFRVAAKACQGLALTAWNDLTDSESADGASLLDEAHAEWAIVERFAERLRGMPVC